MQNVMSYVLDGSIIEVSPIEGVNTEEPDNGMSCGLWDPHKMLRGVFIAQERKPLQLCSDLFLSRLWWWWFFSSDSLGMLMSLNRYVLNWSSDYVATIGTVVTKQRVCQPLTNEEPEWWDLPYPISLFSASTWGI